MNPACQAFTASALPRRRLLLVILFGVVLPLYAFGWLAEAIRNRGGLDWDTPVLKLTHQHDSPSLDKILIFATHNGDIRMVIFFTVVCAIVLLVWRRQRDERFLAHCVVGAAVIIFLVKAAFYRIRPHFGGSPAPDIDLGSPSSHSMGTFVLALALALIVWPTRWRWPVIFLGALYAVSVALSRVYLGAHQTSDVLAAWALALAWVSGLSVLRGITFADLTRKKKCILLVSGILASLVTILAGYVSSDLKHVNLRVVVVKEAYRSGQMNAGHLVRTVEHFDIKSILNLRGEDLTEGWHQAESSRGGSHDGRRSAGLESRCCRQAPHSLRDLSWRVWLMLAISILAVALAWYFYLRGRQTPETPPVAVTDRINVLFAVLFVALLLSGGSTSGPGLGVLLLIGGALILAWNRN